MTQLRSRASGPLAPPRVVLLLVAAMWASEIADAILPVEADAWGIRPRTLGGLLGIPLAPFLHAGFAHLMANTVPFLVLGMLVAWRAGAVLWQILVAVTALGGLCVWLLTPAHVVTIGASGVVFGLLGYLLTAGIVLRSLLDILLSVGVLMVYGTTLVGATPLGVPAGVSWLAHLAGLLSGVLAAAWFAPTLRPGRERATGAL